MIGSIFVIILFSLSVAGDISNRSILTPAQGHLYHGAFTPVENPPHEAEISTESIRSYVDTAGKNIAIGVFSNEWGLNRSFPWKQAEIIRNCGAVPYIRLMLRTDSRQYRKEPVFTLSRIRDGRYDGDLAAWARDAHNFSSPIIVEWGTEVNGNWFPWNGYWNDQAKGVTKFQDAYRHIIEVMKNEHADNLIWVYHVNWNSVPAKAWNTPGAYYPGDAYIDWIGVSLYGAMNQDSEPQGSFTEHLDEAYPDLTNISPGKSIIISEYGTDVASTRVDPEKWTEDALSHLVSGRWPAVIGMCWWNTEWPNDRLPEHNTSMRIQENNLVAGVFKKYIGNSTNVLSKVIPPPKVFIHEVR